ncbi:MAG: hypothetical protein R3E50_05865 [Halioglobus sp.]
MQLALADPARVASLVVADIAPVAYAAHHDAVFAALAAVDTGNCASRDAAASLMAQYLHDPGVIQFLLTSLQREASGTYRWRFDLAGIRAAYPALLAAPPGDDAYPGPVLFIRGGASDYIRDVHWPAIRNGFPAP